MGESDRYSDLKKRVTVSRNIFSPEGNALLSLFFINISFFLVLAFLKLGFTVSNYAPSLFENNILQWMALPGNSSHFWSKPWTLLTYMFCDVDIVRFIVNLIWLWVFGRILQSLYEEVKIVPVYIYGGIVAGITWLIAAYFFSGANKAPALLLGANLPIVTIAAVATFMVPNFKIMQHLNGGISLWILFVIFIAITVASSGSGLHVAAITGAIVTGFVYVFLLRKGIDATAWMVKVYTKSGTWFAPKDKQTKIKKQVFYEAGNRLPFSKVQNVTQKRVDEILDKISQKGYEYLSNEEKEILKKASESDDIK